MKKSHPSWLAKRPKGFIPELSDVVSLEWIEKRLESEGVAADLRSDLEAARNQALKGTLTYREFVALRARAKKKRSPLRSLLTRTRALRRAATRVASVTAVPLAGYDMAIRALEAAIAGTEPVARLRGLRKTVFARLGRRDASSVLV